MAVTLMFAGPFGPRLELRPQSSGTPSSKQRTPGGRVLAPRARVLGTSDKRDKAVSRASRRAGPKPELFLRLAEDLRVGRDGFDDPHVPADDAVVANNGIATQNYSFI